MNKKAGKYPNSNRRVLLERIREARFPKDLEQFTWKELEEAEIFKDYARQTGWDDKTFRQFVLFATQSKELRKHRDELADLVKSLKKYRSPLRAEARVETCPIKSAELYLKAQDDENRVNEQRKNQSNLLYAEMQKWDQKKFGKEWEHRDKPDSIRRFEPVLWCVPMTVMDYHNATGLTRRTLQNFLHRRNAHPIVQPNRVNQPLHYGSETNAAVFCDWLTRRVKDISKRRAIIARTLIRCQRESPEHYDQFLESILPALRTLGLGTEEKMQEFVRYLRNCKKQLHPQPPPLTGYDSLTMHGGVPPEAPSS